MTQLLIEGRQCVLKAGSSFDFVAENRLFSGSDDYTFAIELPLRGCPENIDIFGHLYRPDVDILRTEFDAEIRAGAFSRTGKATVVGVGDGVLKLQFLAGMSVQNFTDGLDKAYIDELDIQTPSVFDPARISPSAAMALDAPSDWVALPWINSQYGTTHNFVSVSASPSGRSLSWHQADVGLSWMPYLLPLSRSICEALGFSCDFSPWESDPVRSKILCCNALRTSVNQASFNYASLLPHWTFEEYLGYLSEFLGASFDIDYRARTVSMRSWASLVDDAAPVCLDVVEDAFEAEISADADSCNFYGNRIFSYGEMDSTMGRYYSCPWFLPDSMPQYFEDLSHRRGGYNGGSCRFRSLEDMREECRWLAVSDGSPCPAGSPAAYRLYCDDVEQWFMVRDVYHQEITVSGGSVATTRRIARYYLSLQPIDEFGPSDYVPDGQDDGRQTVELKFIPASIAMSEPAFGWCLWLDVDDESDIILDTDSLSVPDFDPDRTSIQLSPLEQILQAGEQEENKEIYSRIFFAWYDPAYRDFNTMPRPHVSRFHFRDDMSAAIRFPIDFSLKGEAFRSRFRHLVDPAKKYRFSFISDSIPDVRGVFIIHGRRYLCEKMTATFAADAGMSQLIKGEFWRITD